VSKRCNFDDDDAYEYAEIDNVIYEDDRIRTKEESGAILGLEDMTTYEMKPESILIIHTEENNTSKLEMVVGSIVGNIKKMFAHLDKAIDNMIDRLRNTDKALDFTRTKEIESDINNYRRMLKERSIVDINENRYNYELGVSYMDFINECEHMGDYVVNVVQASNYADR
jgi:hypothetical protein